MNRPAAPVSLKQLNTLGVDARAATLVTLERPGDLEALDFDPGRDLVLGEGSNVLLAGDVPGRVILNRLRGRRMVGGGNRSDNPVIVEAAGGEPWHDLVRWSLDQGLCGLENLSLIPGLAGAAPMQNIGAYGVELADCFESLTAWDWRDRRLRDFGLADCRFGYRDSRFKSLEPNRYLIVNIRLRLERQFTPKLEYPGLADELRAAGITRPTARDVSDAVIRVRQRKLPDPAVIGNAGSFFRNPVLARDQAEALRKRFPGLPVYAHGEAGAKLGAAWMIDHCGWKGRREGDAGISEQHALVLVNHGNAGGPDLLHLAMRVRDSVRDTFGVTLENEPRIVQFGPEPT